MNNKGFHIVFLETRDGKTRFLLGHVVFLVITSKNIEKPPSEPPLGLRIIWNMERASPFRVPTDPGRPRQRRADHVATLAGRIGRWTKKRKSGRSSLGS